MGSDLDIGQVPLDFFDPFSQAPVPFQLFRKPLSGLRHRRRCHAAEEQADLPIRAPAPGSGEYTDSIWLANMLRMGILPEGFIYPKE